MRKQLGFTLVELLVVFALLGLLLAVAPAAFERMRESAQYRDTVRSLLSELRQARRRAVMEHVEVRFQVDLGARSFGAEARPQREVPKPIELRATVAAIELRSNGTAAIRFLPQGGATGGSIDVLRPSGAGVRLTVDWLSGHVIQSPLGS